MLRDLSKFIACVLPALLIGLVVGYGFGMQIGTSQEEGEVNGAPNEALVSEWRGSAQGKVRALENGFITISDDEGRSMHALLRDTVSVRRTTISGAQSQVENITLADVQLGQEAIVLVGSEEGMMVALEINIVEIITNPISDGGTLSEDSK